MEGDTFLKFCVILSNLSPGNAPKWNAGVLKIYEIGLRSVPDCAASALTEIIVDLHEFRPSVSEIKKLYLQLTHGAKRTALDVIDEIISLRDKYGQYGVREYADRNIYRLGPPAELSADAAKTVAAYGGWCSFCQDDSPGGVQRGHLLKFAQAAIDGQSSETMLRLQLEFQDLKDAASPPLVLIEHAYTAQSETQPRSMTEAGASHEQMSRLGALPLREMIRVIE